MLPGADGGSTGTSPAHVTSIFTSHYVRHFYVAAEGTFQLWFARGRPAFIGLASIFWLMIAKSDLTF
ncbi:hypothetical protein DI396_08380 [Litorivita pollutaquae]|uniref:Uncharacterized protein n=1 Tax=Litorivita pollutaquae TaxID=2200892 RepID=A0A2V4NCW4_9RHOB|nr:hypothetical protein DI396_08380 [Litorivita pollutaquae]